MSPRVLYLLFGLGMLALLYAAGLKKELTALGLIMILGLALVNAPTIIKQFSELGLLGKQTSSSPPKQAGTTGYMQVQTPT